MPSIKDVAAEARVSSSTVSKVLNERTDANISLATRERIRIAAHRIGYHPSALARGLAGKRMNTIGVVMAYSQESVTSDPYLGPCLDGILAAGKTHQQRITLFLEGDWSDALQNVPVYGAGNCDGLLVIIPRVPSPFLAHLKDRHPRLPFVLIGDSRDTEPFPCVDLDNVEAARQITAHLIRHGHRRIAAFCGNRDFSSNGQRFTGYRQALLEAGIPFDPTLVFPGEYHAEDGARNAALLLDCFKNADRPTAVFGFCDVVAIGAMNELRKRGLRVPDDISVVGIDDSPQSCGSGLTTIRQSVSQVGRVATETLLRIIADEMPPTARVLLPPVLIERGSVGRGAFAINEETNEMKGF